MRAAVLFFRISPSFTGADCFIIPIGKYIKGGNTSPVFLITWLTSHWADVLLTLGLLVVVVAAVAVLVKDKKDGKSSCGCGCSNCAMAGSCSKKPKEDPKTGG